MTTKISSSISIYGLQNNVDEETIPSCDIVGKSIKIIAAEINSSKTLRMNADLNPEVKDTLLKKAEFQDKKHHLLTNKDEYLKILKTVEEVLETIEKELATHKKGNKHY